jgi:hypothetical protein
MPIQESFVEGWTEPIDYQLKRATGDSEILQPFDAGGTTVSLVAHDHRGNRIAIAGSVAWLSAAVSKVRYIPHANDLKAIYGVMHVRFKVVSGSNIGYFPRNREGLEWAIAKGPK